MEVDKIKKILSSVLYEIKKTSCAVYLFGSVLHKKHYRDIDILILYDQHSDIAISKHIIESLFPESMIHFTCLTRIEERELDFVRITNAVEIK